jgi:hypothetical protein
MRIGGGWNVGKWFVVFLVGMAVLPAAWAADPQTNVTAAEVKPPVARGLATDDERNAELRAKLARRTDAAFIETPFNQVLDFLSDAVDVPFHVKTGALDEIGLSRDVPVTSNFKDVSVATALELILDDLQLEFAVDRGLVIISTPDDLQAKQVVRAYRLQSLLPDLATEQIDREAGRLARIIAAQIAPDTWGLVEVRAFPASDGDGASGAGGGMMGMGAAMPPGVGQPGEMPGTVHLGGSGAISVFDRVLIVRNSIKVHDEVDQFLRMLGEARAAAK